MTTYEYEIRIELWKTRKIPIIGKIFTRIMKHTYLPIDADIANKKIDSIINFTLTTKP